MKNILTVIFILAIIFSGCKKAGEGGSTTIDVRVLDTNAVPVYHAKVYVQYNTLERSGNPEIKFDDSLSTNFKGQAVFTQLRRGDYFFYAVYTDTVRLDSLSPVTEVKFTGGEGIHIRNNSLERAVVINLEKSEE